MAYETKTGTIFNIQKFSIHDGTGIRTLIFMKGCPLACLWCSNPESQSPEPEIMDVKTNCIRCGKCAALCPNHAVKGSHFQIDRSLCLGCGKCAQTCWANAKKVTGRKVTLREVMEMIEKDRIFYTNSGGGVTIGGGEPLMQQEFVKELLRACKDSNIHTAMETCGHGRWEAVKGVFQYTDQIFFDLKAMDSDLHEKLTGRSNHLILENARHLSQLGKEITFRIPLVPGCNDSKENIKATGDFTASLQKKNRNISIEILPYHNLGQDKYQWLDVPYSLHDLTRPSEETLIAYRKLLAETCENVVGL